MPPGQRVDPFPSFNVLVEIDGITRAAFQQCNGVGSTIEVITYRQGGENQNPRQLPGLTTHTNIILKWGMTDDMELYNWHRDAVLGRVDRKNLSVVVLDRQGNEKGRWNVFNAWPTKYTGPDFNAEENAVAIETLELAHEGIERVRV